MKSTHLILAGAVCLSGCATLPSQQPQVPPPSVTQIQSYCFENVKTFQGQTSCIETTISSYPGTQSDPLIQEHLMYMRSLSEKVARKAMSATDARLALTRELRELREMRDKALAQTRDEEATRTMQTLEALKATQSPPVVFHPVSPRLVAPVTTNCIKNGNAVNCSTY